MERPRFCFPSLWSQELRSFRALVYSSALSPGWHMYKRTRDYLRGRLLGFHVL
ncbi:hypothetical protein LEMLEM_LOCUS977 [Lemmus lemmus]